MKALLTILTYACAISCLLSCVNSTPSGTNITVAAEHPRLLLHEGEEKLITEKIASEKFLEDVHLAIIAQSEDFLSAPELKRIKTGKRLLDVSRNAFRQIYFLSYSWRMTGDGRFAMQAEKVMLDVCRFSDWNPTHFLDVAEMTAAVAIGYDWLYDWLSQESREIICAAIIDKGLAPSVNVGKEELKNIHWLEKKNNWNAVCNMGMAFGALAVYEHCPELASEIIVRAMDSVKNNTLKEYSPDGNYPEGYMYWNYGTAFLIMLSDALESAAGIGLGLDKDYGFMRSAEYMVQMTTQDFGCFSYSDCNVSENALCLPLFWFASRTNDNSLLYGEADRIEYLTKNGKEDRMYETRYLPSVLLWAGKGCFKGIRPPEECMFVGQGETPVAIMRNHWGGDDEIFLGLKCGSCKGGHSHMDIGSFVMYRGKYQWAEDLGHQDYYSMEKYGITLNQRTQYSSRWAPFRLGMYSHNLIIFADSLQRVDAHVKVDRYGERPGFRFAAADLTSLQGGLVAGHRRGVAITGQDHVIIRDEIDGGSRPVPFRWAMLTPSDVKMTSDSSAILSQGQERMRLIVSSDRKIKLRTFSTAPVHEYDAPNPGTVMIGFCSEAGPGEKLHVNVFLVPESSYGDFGNEEVLPLEKW